MSISNQMLHVGNDLLNAIQTVSIQITPVVLGKYALGAYEHGADYAKISELLDTQFDVDVSSDIVKSVITTHLLTHEPESREFMNFDGTIEQTSMRQAA